jgi:hypothetical protein
MQSLTLVHLILMLIVAVLAGRVLGMIGLALSTLRDVVMELASKRRHAKIMRVVEGRELERKYLVDNSLEHLSSLLALGYDGYLTPTINAVASVALAHKGASKVLLHPEQITHNPKVVVDILNMVDFEASLTENGKIQISNYSRDKADRALSVLMALKNRRD